jgi:hypothetical protein
MPATKEMLLEQIRGVEVELANAMKLGLNVDLLKERLRLLQDQFVAANEALNEGKNQLLKS